MRDIDEGLRGVAAALVRQSREQAGLTQTQLAERAHTTQSAIAAYEAGDREPTLPVLGRFMEAMGFTLEVSATPQPTIYTLAQVARGISASDEMDTTHRLRLVCEFLRGAGEEAADVVLLTAKRPDSTGDPRFDALLGAIAEDLCFRANQTAPAWAGRPERFLDGAWWVSPLPSAKAGALVHTPASYRRRGIMIERRDLEAA